jgi:predicted porin
VQKFFLLLLLFSGALYAKSVDYLSVAYDNLDFKNSKQKDRGNRYTVHLQKGFEKIRLNVAYEKTDTKTYQPPLKDDLRVDKLYTKLSMSLFDKDSLWLGYIYIDDNIAPTDGTRIYSLGYVKGISKEFALFGTLYYGDFTVLDTMQYDLGMKYRLQHNALTTLLIAKYIYIDISNCTHGFCKNAQDSYKTLLLKSKFDYQSYFLHIGAAFGKRAFSVMQSGFACSHHAMEFNKTYMMGIGKRFGNVELKVRYAYLEATELPLHNSGVKINDVMLRMKYFF